MVALDFVSTRNRAVARPSRARACQIVSAGCLPKSAMASVYEAMASPSLPLRRYMLAITAARRDWAPASPLARDPPAPIGPAPADPGETPAETMRFLPGPPRLVVTPTSIGEGEPESERRFAPVTDRVRPGCGCELVLVILLRLVREGETGMVEVRRGGLSGRPLGGTEVGRGIECPFKLEERGDGARAGEPEAGGGGREL